MSSLQKGEDVLAILPYNGPWEKHDFYGLRNHREGERPFIVSVVNLLVEPQAAQANVESCA